MYRRFWQLIPTHFQKWMLKDKEIQRKSLFPHVNPFLFLSLLLFGDFVVVLFILCVLIIEYDANSKWPEWQSR